MESGNADQEPTRLKKGFRKEGQPGKGGFSKEKTWKGFSKEKTVKGILKRENLKKGKPQF